MSRRAAPDRRRNDLRQREIALARWDSEGGAGPRRKGARTLATGKAPLASPRPPSADLVQLRIRVIALENLVITLLAEGSERQFPLARAMAVHVSPRPGFTPHRMTSHAAAQMRHLIRRAEFFRNANPSDPKPD